MTFILLMLLLTAQPTSPSQAQPCLNYEPDTVTISGRLKRKTFPGPPNYKSIAKGDAREEVFVLKLEKPLCVNASVDAFASKVAI